MTMHSDSVVASHHEVFLWVVREATHAKAISTEQEQAKQELGQHLWNATKELEASSKREQQLRAQIQETQQEFGRLHEVGVARERELQLQSEAQRNQLHEELKKQLEAATATASEERAQKEELNALMITEISRFQAEMEQLSQQHAAALVEREKAAEEERIQALELREKAERVVREAQGELKELRAELQSTKEDKARLEAQGSAESGTLQELNEQLRDTAGQLEDSNTQLEHISSRSAGGQEAQLTRSNEQLRQQIQELEHLRSAGASQLLQLQKVLDTQRARSAALETEKRDLLAEAEQLNVSLEAQYRVVNDKQLELEQELARALEEKSQRLEEMLDMLTQLQNKGEDLEQVRAQEAEVSRQQLASLSHQLSEARQARTRAESAVAAAAQAQQEAQAQAHFEVEQLRATLTTQLAELEAQKEAQTAELRRLEAELERATRSKQSLQLELQRATDDTQDALRAVEVARRDARAQSQQLGEEHERLRQELEAARIESQENAAMAEELQNKITTIQTAANATIDDLVSELQGAQDTLEIERARAKKEKDAGGIRSQLRELEEQLRSRDSQLREARDEAARNQEQLEERLSELELRLQRTGNTLESKKQECDAKTREMETLSRRAGDAERKLSPLTMKRERGMNLFGQLENVVRLMLSSQNSEMKTKFRNSK
eukprot:jgi/Phyca11/535315/estExt2_fgenesh1_pg.C_PHYCAscaffold_340034